MSTNLKAKLNQLLQSTPPHTVILSSWLVKRGYSLDLQKKYKKNNWLESVGYGAMKRSGDDIDYLSGIYAIQSQANLKIHIGAQSALSLLGKSQYLELSDKPTIKLFSIKNNDLPLWFKNYHWNINISFNIASFLPSDLGLSDYSVHNNFKVKISTPARAIMECIHLASNNQDYIECYESMEGLNNLNPRTVQLLLENCSSIKIKRMFLFLAEFQKHEWFNYLDLKKIDLGKGKRSLIKNGAFDSKYQITIPKEWKYHDKSEL